MGHSHGTRPHDHSSHSSGNIGVAFLLNLAFAAIELVGGLLTGSVAIIADALHDFGDSLTLALAWGLQKYAAKGRTSTFTYGYGRVSLLSSLISGIVLFGGSVLVVSHAIPELWNKDRQPHGWGMLGLAIFGVAINGFAAYRLSKGRTRNEQMLSWHLIEDLLGWVAVLVGSLVILATGWVWVDPALAIAIGCFIAFNVVRNLRDSVQLFLQRIPDGFDVQKFSDDIATIPGVVEAHDVHAWTLDGEKNVLSMHLKTKGRLPDYRTIKELKREVSLRLERWGHFHLTLEVEPEDSDCSDHQH